MTLIDLSDGEWNVVMELILNDIGDTCWAIEQLQDLPYAGTYLRLKRERLECLRSVRMKMRRKI